MQLPSSATMASLSLSSTSLFLSLLLCTFTAAYDGDSPNFPPAEAPDDGDSPSFPPAEAPYDSDSPSFQPAEVPDDSDSTNFPPAEAPDVVDSPSFPPAEAIDDGDSPSFPPAEALDDGDSPSFPPAEAIDGDSPSFPPAEAPDDGDSPSYPRDETPYVGDSSHHLHHIWNPTHPLTTPPPTHPPTPPLSYPPVKPPARKKVAVQGVVYCKACKFRGVDTLVGATPLVGAVVKLECNNSKHGVREQQKTDKNGYFFFMSAKLSTYGAHKCKVSLLSSPVAACSAATTLHGGATGAILFRSRSTLPKPLLPFELFTVGPFAFDAPKKFPCPY